MVIEETYHNIIRHIHDKPTTNTQQWKDESLPANIWNKTKMLTLTTSLQTSIGSLNHSNQTRKRNKSIQMDREEVK